MRFFVAYLCFVCLATLVIQTPLALAQDSHQQLTGKDIASLSFDDLLEVSIHSVSKSDENVFETPLASTVITRKEILNYGATSIAEALRLAPGVIVREITPGIYDIHIRGFDYLPPGGRIFNAPNSLSLVMINNRIFYSYFSGGTFWHAIPVDVHDVKQIEIIRGPASALYGPNAVTGVIHIITRDPESSLDMNVAGGNNETGLARAAIGYKGENSGLRLSANAQTRDRDHVDYFQYVTESFHPTLEGVQTTTGAPLSQVDERYPDIQNSLERSAINLFGEWRPEDDIFFEAELGIQESQAQVIDRDVSATPLTTVQTDSHYMQLKGNVYNFSGHLSLIDGEHGTLAFPGLQHEHRNFQSSLAYDYNLNRLRIRPELSFLRHKYDGEPFLGGSATQNVRALSMLSDYSYSDFRFVGAIRGDRYDHRSKEFLSYQASVTWAPFESTSLRANYGRAHRSPFMVDTYRNVSFAVGNDQFITTLGNKDLDPLLVDSFEVGWREKISQDLEMDLEVFYSEISDYTDLLFDSTNELNSDTTTVLKYRNIDFSARQTGSTLSLLFSLPEANLNGRIFGTIQETQMDGSFAPAANGGLPFSGENQNTPAFFGGGYINWSPYTHWNFNVSTYYFDSSTQNNLYHSIKVSSKVLMNVKVSYELAENMSLYFNARNLLDDDSREFGHTDKIGGTYLGGFSATFQ